MDDKDDTESDPLQPILDRLPAEKRASARETLRWFVDFAIRLGDRIGREEADERLDTPPETEHRANEER